MTQYIKRVMNIQFNDVFTAETYGEAATLAFSITTTDGPVRYKP